MCISGLPNEPPGSTQVASDKCKLNWMKPIKQKHFPGRLHLEKEMGKESRQVSEDSSGTCNGREKQGRGVMDIILRLQFPSAASCTDGGESPVTFGALASARRGLIRITVS